MTETNDENYKLIERNLKNALEYERKLNQQITGRLDAYESIIKIMLKTLIDSLIERR